MGKIHLRIITPSEMKVDEPVDMVIMRCIDGDWGILPGHDMRSAVLDYGAIRVINDKNERRLAVYGGIAEIQNDVLTILVNEAHFPEDIDRAQAEMDLHLAENHLREKLSEADIRSNEVMLRRALVQIEVSSYPLLNINI